MPYNLGCAEGWNTIIKSFLFSPYWVIVNDDVSFTPGFLKELHENFKNSSYCDYLKYRIQQVGEYYKRN